VLAGPVDARGRPALEDAKKLYGAAHIEVTARAQWDEAGLGFVSRAG
jgi:hypothetical protein